MLATGIRIQMIKRRTRRRRSCRRKRYRQERQVVSDKQPYLCNGCPAKGFQGVDFDLQGGCPYTTADSFRQTRRYRIECPDDYESNEQMAKLSSATLRYYDPEEDDYFERQGDIDAARIGILCAEEFLKGNCQKTRDLILNESEID
jgi:hypothetical protein